MSNRRKRRGNVTSSGRSITAPLVRYTKLEHGLLASAAYQALTPNARSLLTQLATLENSHNNGLIWLSVRDAAARMGVANLRSAAAAFDQLQDMGFIVCTKQAHFQVKVAEASRARCWRLTWLPLAGGGRPTHDYAKLEPDPKTLERRRMIAGQKAWKKWRQEMQKGKLPVVDLHTQVPKAPENMAAPVGELHTANPAKPAKLPMLVVGDLHTHTAVTMGYGGSDVQRPTCWASGRANSLDQLLAAFATQARPELAVAA